MDIYADQRVSESFVVVVDDIRRDSFKNLSMKIIVIDEHISTSIRYKTSSRTIVCFDLFRSVSVLEHVRQKW